MLAIRIETEKRLDRLAKKTGHQAQHDLLASLDERDDGTINQTLRTFRKVPPGCFRTGSGNTSTTNGVEEKSQTPSRSERKGRRGSQRTGNQIFFASSANIATFAVFAFPFGLKLEAYATPQFPKHSSRHQRDTTSR